MSLLKAMSLQHGHSSSTGAAAARAQQQHGRTGAELTASVLQA